MTEPGNFVLYCNTCKDYPDSFEMQAQDDGAITVTCRVCETAEVWE